MNGFIVDVLQRAVRHVARGDTARTHRNALLRQISRADQLLVALSEGYEVWLGGFTNRPRRAPGEAQRGNRIAGVNRGSARAAHADLEYDVEVDTTDVPLPALARELYERYQAGRLPGAFDRLRKRFLS